MGSTIPHSISQAFIDLAQSNPSKSALIYLGTRYSYDKIKNMALSFAASLSDMGIQPGDRVIIYLPNSPQWVISWLGILMRGAVAVPITPIYTPHDLLYIANDSDAKAIVCTDLNFGYVTQVFSDTGLKKIIHTNVADLLPWWKRAFGVLFDRIPKGNVSSHDDSIPFREVLRTKSDRFDLPELSGDEIAFLVYTGGTTKSPKGVPVTHDLFLDAALHHYKVIEPLIPWGENVTLQGAPLFHILGQVFGMGVLIVSGDTLVLLPRMNLDGLMAAIQQYRTKMIVGVPAFYRMILDHDRLDFYDLSSLSYCMSGGDVLPGDIADRWKERFGVPLFSGYGATETVGGVSMSHPNKEHPPLSMGTVIANRSVMIVDQKSLQEVETGSPGEILVRSDPMVSSYWNKPEETEAAFVEVDGQLWYRTGDIVSMDKDGYLYFVDRTVDTIKHKGYRISASEIEAVLLEHPAVTGSCVVGVPDEKVGERIKAYVVLKEDIKGMTGYDLTRYCRERLVAYKIPQYIEFRDMLPKSKVGKLLRREVRSEERKRSEKGKWDEVTSDST